MLASNQPCDQNSKQLIYLQLLCPDNHPVFHFQYSFQYIIWDSQHFMVTEALCWDDSTVQLLLSVLSTFKEG